MNTAFCRPFPHIADRIDLVSVNGRHHHALMLLFRREEFAGKGNSEWTGCPTPHANLIDRQAINGT